MITFERKTTACTLARLCVCALIICGFTNALHAEVLPKTAAIVPVETVFLMEIDNFSELQTQFQKTNLYKLYKDPAMTPFFNDVKSKWQDFLKKQKNTILKTIVNAEILPEGRVAAALVMTQKAIDINEPMVLLIAQWGQQAPHIKKVITETTEKAIEQGARRKIEDYRGISIKTIIAKDSARLGYGFSSTMSYCFIDDCLLASEDIELLKFTIAHLKGATSPTLASSSDYTTTIKAVGPYHDIDFYINIKQILKTVTAKNPRGLLQGWITKLGFDNVTSFGCATAFARQSRISCSAKAILKINGTKKGVCKMLEAESTALNMPQFIPPSTYSATTFNLNLKKACEELGRFLPEAASILYMPIPTSESMDTPPLQIKRDIIDHLGSQILFTQSLNKPFSKDTSPTDSIFALMVNDRAAIEKSLSLLHSKAIAPNNPDAQRQLLGHTIYLIDLPTLSFMPGQMTPLQDPAALPAQPITKMAFTITDTHLVFGLESTVERVIRTLNNPSAESIKSTKWFNNARAALPSITAFAYLEDSAASAELLWWMLQVIPKSLPDGPASVNMGSQMLGKFVNFELLPDYEAVRKYFGLSVSYGISRPDGFFFELKDIKFAGK